MKQLFKPKERFSLGLDIGTQAIKIVKLRFTPLEKGLPSKKDSQAGFIQDTVELCSFGLEPNQLDPVEVLKKIKEPQGQELVNIAVSGSSTVIRYVNFPKMNALELKQALKFEAQKHIPFAVNETNVDGYILKEDLPDNKMLILIAAVKKELINQRLKLIEEAGFRVKIIDLDSLALDNAFKFNYSQEDTLKHKAIALLNIGTAISNLNILESGLPRFSRDIHIAGNNFTHRLMDVFNMDFKSAEGLKLNPQGEASGKMTAALEPVFTNLASGIRTSFDYYESQSTTSVTKIFLSGGGSKFTGLKDILTNLLGIEVDYWDPLKRINLSSNIDAQKIKELSSQLAVAIGLGLRQ